MFVSKLRFLESHRFRESFFKEERNPLPKNCSKVSNEGGLRPSPRPGVGQHRRLEGAPVHPQ